ncbi:MAG: tetratricopeptide repeat protein, partial [Rudaea sp.]
QGPDDFFNLTQAVEPHLAAFNLEQLISYLRFSGWDSHIFFKCFPVLLEQAVSASERLKEELRIVIADLWEHFYYVGGESDMPFDLGMLLFKLGDHSDALRYFDISLQMYGPAASTFYNQAVCLFRFDRNDEALQAVDRALEAKPDMEQAQKLRAAILKDIKTKE